MEKSKDSLKAYFSIFLTISKLDIPKLLLIIGCTPWAIPTKMEIATKAMLATIPYAATPILPESLRIMRLNIINTIPEEISVIRDD
ncbi:MAG: hypothetical protein K0S61_3807, partial [Anaerocolumna sp.]|nr:hypothetical protein [Anaerocolumna sp.]